jgi:hypothetical protein
MSAVDRVIDYTARKFESGPDGYSALTLDDVGTGIAFGFIQFNQRAGSLPALFREMSSVAPLLFSKNFGPYAPKMLSTPWVQGTNLAGDPDFLQRLKAAGPLPEFQQAQRNLARSGYFDPIVAAVKGHGLKSERAYAMVYDTAVQRGPAQAKRCLEGAVHAAGAVQVDLTLREFAVLLAFAPLADATSRVTTDRRARMLKDPGLSDAPLVW